MPYEQAGIAWGTLRGLFLLRSEAAEAVSALTFPVDSVASVGMSDLCVPCPLCPLCVREILTPRGGYENFTFAHPCTSHFLWGYRVCSEGLSGRLNIDFLGFYPGRKQRQNKEQ